MAVVCRLLAIMAVPFAGNASMADCSARGSAQGIAAGHDMSGKVVFFTGSDTGIGYETALALAGVNASIIIANHNSASGQAAAANITRLTGNRNVEVEQLDLASFKSIRAVAALVLAKRSTVDIVINDAGMGSAGGTSLTEDGFEEVMQVNYIGHFLLEQLFLPALRASKGKLIHVASGSGFAACQNAKLPAGCINDVDVLDKMVKTPSAPNTSNYGITKLMMIYNARELAAREAARGSGMRAYAVRPGLVDTPLVRRGMPPPVQKRFCSWPICAAGRRGLACDTPCPMPETAGGCSPTYVAVTALPADLDGELVWLCRKEAPPAWGDAKQNQAKLYDMSLRWIGSVSTSLTV